jgi:Ran GTPase-activating protein (RanGAP) involved in mRNA processing and transport
MAKSDVGPSIPAQWKDPIDEIIRKLESNDDRSLKSLAMQRLQKISSTTAHAQLIPTQRLLSALSVNTTVENLELWIPEYDEYDVETTSDNRSYSQDLFALLTDMLATNRTIRRLTILPSINIIGWKAIMKGLHENDTISHLAIEDLLPTGCSLYNTSNDSLTSISINRYWMMAPTTATNAVMQFFSDISNLKSLQLLEINNFEADHINAALEAMNGHLKISNLELINCNVNMLVTFPFLPSLTHLRLIDCQLTEASLQAVCQSLSRNNDTLELLDLRGNTVLSRHSACSILHHLLLRSSTKLSKLILELCNIDDFGLHILCGPGLPSNIHSLILRDNKLSNCDIWSGQIVHPELLDIDLSDNALGRNAKALENFVRSSCCSVERLQLESCHLSAESVHQLCLILGQCNGRLRDLNLSHNNAVSDVSSSIAHLLQEATALQSINLSSCRISDTFLEVLWSLYSASSMKMTLHELILSCNEISNIGISHLSTLLKRLPNCLKRIDLQSNPFDKDGLEILVDCMADHNYDLTDVRVSLFSKNDQSVKAKLHHWLQLNRAGRSKISSVFISKADERVVDWPSALADADTVYSFEAVYYILRNCPSIFCDANDITTTS